MPQGKCNCVYDIKQATNEKADEEQAHNTLVVLGIAKVTRCSKDVYVLFSAATSLA